MMLGQSNRLNGWRGVAPRSRVRPLISIFSSGGVIMRALRLFLNPLLLVLCVTQADAAMAYLQQGLRAFERGQYAQALRVFFPLAQSGLADAQFFLGMMFDNGKGVREDKDMALTWYRQAAAQGHINAQYYLGVKYLRGDGVAADLAQSLAWYRRAAAQGDSSAQFALGESYEHGRGAAADLREAQAWYEKAAAQGHVGAQLRLGQWYFDGDRLPRDVEKARYYWRAAAAQGSVRAARALQQLPAAPSAATDDGRLASPPPLYSAEPSSSGSGFIVSDRYVLTNHHVVDGCALVRVRRQGLSINGDVAAASMIDDMALISFPSPLGEAVPLRDIDQIRLGEKIFVVGYPLRGFLADDIVITSGEVNALAGPYNDRRYIQISAPVQNGNSGGPVFDSAGNVIAMVVSSLNSIDVARQTGDIAQNVNFAIKVSVIKTFLRQSGVSFDTLPSDEKREAEAIADASRDGTVMVECFK
jgi:S1-C subfamily serine protease